MLKLYFYALLSVILCPTSLHAQSPEKAVQYLKDSYQKENIYIHYDKSSYVAGETIWFKAYLLADAYPSLLSTAINVELINDSGRIISKQILPVIGSAAMGNFNIPLDLPQMNYTVRAYTRNMLNFGNDGFYYNSIAIFNPTSNPTLVSTSDEPQVHFLPEGGNIIEGVNNVIAFKCTDKYGYPLHLQGTLYDEKSAVVATFTDFHDGRGKFSLTPGKGKSYTSVCIINGKKITAELPLIRTAGVAFHVESDAAEKYFILNKEKANGTVFSPAYMLGVMENVVVFKTPLDGASNYIKGRLPLEKLPSGILQLTLFNSADQPLAERMVFVNNNDLLMDGELKTDTVSTKRHQKNVYTFSLKDTTEGTFSIAVTDYEQEIPRSDKENIISRILLSNDIKDKLFDPLYYFEKKDEERANALDLVMMTSGWRRFNWDMVLNNRLPALTYKDNNYISFGGVFYEAGTNEVLANTPIKMIATTHDASFSALTFTTDAEGRGMIPGMIFNDTAVFNFQSLAEKKVPVALSMYNLPLSKLFNYPALSFAGRAKQLEKPLGLTGTVNALYATAMANYNDKYRLLESVKVESAIAQKKQDKISLRYKAFIPHMTNGQYYVDSRLSPMDVEFFERNGMYTSSYSQTPIWPRLYSVNPFANQYVSSPNNIMGQLGFSWASENSSFLEFRTSHYNPNAWVNDSRYTMNVLRLEGFSPVEEFFSPDYAIDNNVNPDERSTLYWNPHLETSNNNKSFTVSFFNSDEAKKFKVILTGMTADGKLLYIEKIIE